MHIPSTVLATRPEPGGSSVDLPRGTNVGRYLVLDKIGEGGMGSVYAAYDPRLDRRIALKMLKSSYGRGAAQSTIVDEAKAMARLAHPNVVTLHDVLVEQDRVFIAMELVDGESLRAWGDGAPRTWAELLAMYVQAGRGLAAAHAAGIVHRDFKPDNVLVGKDGRARVADFGLSVGAEPSLPPPPLGAPPEDKESGSFGSSTGSGSIVGTPRYMPPEQLAGGRAGPAADQFAFCASLWEALYGEPPFGEEEDLLVLVSNVQMRALRAPRGGRAPAWVRQVLERGLSTEPKARHASMEALVVALESDPRKRARRRWLLVAAVGLAAGTMGVVGLHRRWDAVACERQSRLDGVWDADRRGAVHAAFVATGRGYAEDSFARVAKLLDARAKEWTGGAAAACEDRADRGVVRARRAQCYGERKTEMRALVDVLAHADKESVERAVQATRALPAVASCTGADPVVDRPRPTDPAVQERAAALDERMRVTDALRATGQFDASVASARADLKAAEDLAFPPFVADAALALGRAQFEAGLFPAAEESLKNAAVAAEAAGMGRTAALAWIYRGAVALERAEYALADERYDFATAWVDRYGEEGLVRGELLLGRATRFSEGGDYDRAGALGRQALEVFERIGSDRAVWARNEIGVAADMLGHYDEARRYYQQVIDEQEKRYGPDHPSVAKVIVNLGLLQLDAGKVPESIALLERAYHIQIAALGREHPRTIDTECAIANAYEMAGRMDEALVLARHAVELAPRVFGADNANVGYSLAMLSNALLGMHQPGEAVDVATRELAYRERDGVAPAFLADAHADLGRALVESGRDPARGAALLHKAREEFVSLNRTSRVEEIDEALSRASAAPAKAR